MQVQQFSVYINVTAFKYVLAIYVLAIFAKIAKLKIYLYLCISYIYLKQAIFVFASEIHLLTFSNNRLIYKSHFYILPCALIDNVSHLIPYYLPTTRTMGQKCSPSISLSQVCLVLWCYIDSLGKLARDTVEFFFFFPQTHKHTIHVWQEFFWGKKYYPFQLPPVFS